MSGGSDSVPMAYQPTGSAQADQTYQQLSGQYGQGAAQIQSNLPTYQNLISGYGQNPYSGLAQQGAGQVAQQGQGVGQQQISAGQNLFQGAGQITPYAQDQLTQAYDPQRAVYNQQYGQLMDHQNAINAMNGVAGSPYAAEVSGQQGQNFDLSWLASQAGRQQQALSAYTGAIGAQGNLYNQASGLENQGLQTWAASSQLPYQTYLGQLNDQVSGINSAVAGESGTLTPEATQMNSLLQYLGVGQSATSVNQKGQAQQNQQDSSFWAGLANLGGQGASALQYL